MATVAAKTETRVLLRGISWPTYEALVRDLEDSGKRLTYDQGYLEIMSPSDEHERFKRLIGRMIEAMTEELDIPIRSAGSTTWKIELRKRGLEPDECYYVASESKIRGRDEIDLDQDPPPDLALEVDLSRPCIEKLPIYAELGVPELWCYDGESLRIMLLQADGRYVQAPAGAAFAFLPPAEIERFLARRNETDETTWIRGFREWVRGLRP